MTWEVLRSLDPEPPLGTVVVDQDGLAWVRSPDYGTRFGWGTVIPDAGECRSWVRLAGNHGPVVVVVRGLDLEPETDLTT